MEAKASEWVKAWKTPAAVVVGVAILVNVVTLTVWGQNRTKHEAVMDERVRAMRDLLEQNQALFHSLDIEFSTFRDKLLPGQDEEWQIKI